jgi:Big-like domain-containing protein
MRGRCGAAAVAGLLVCFSGCAKPGLPPGGPVDRIPPRLILAAPADSSVRIPTTEVVEFLFSEGMDRNSVRDGIKVYPAPGRPTFHWKGRRLRVTWARPLEPATTYQVLLSAGVRDYHGVPLGQSIAIRFATGDSLDPGVVSGALRAKTLPTKGVPIWIYPDSAGRAPDFAAGPAYATETDTTGVYRLSGLPLGRGFTVHAVYDQNRDGAFDSTVDVAASAPGLIRLTPDHPVADSVNIVAVDPRGPALVLGAIATRDSTARIQIEARAESDSVRVARVIRVGPGEYTLRVPPGRYWIVATRLEALEGKPRPTLRRPEALPAAPEGEYPGVDFDFRPEESAEPPPGVEGVPPGEPGE